MVCTCVALIQRDILDHTGTGFRFDHRIQDHWPLTILRCQPLQRQQVSQRIAAGTAGQFHGHIIIEFQTIVHQVGGGHGHNGVAEPLGIKGNTAILCQDRDQVPGFQGEPIATETAAVSVHDNGFFQPGRGHIVKNIRVGVQLRIAQTGM